MTVEELLAQYKIGIREFRNINIAEANLSGAKLSQIILAHSNLSIVNFSGTDLHQADLSHAKLNVARLHSANLQEAILHKTILNVANLIRANLNRTQLQQASLIRAELIRANLSYANLMDADLSSADLREATLRQAKLINTNLSGAILQGAILDGANLTGANLHGTDLKGANLSGTNMQGVELRQANLSHTDLSGSNLSGANLRWANLSGANLCWTNLSEAKLSGANLAGADLSNANLANASLVHANLNQATLINAEWIGADLTGATLTAAKLYGTSRFGLKTNEIICEWIDLSPQGDGSMILNFYSEELHEFFNQTPPTIKIIVDQVLDPEANFALAGAYFQIAQKYPAIKQPPTIEIGLRRTVFTFNVDSDRALFPMAYITILPFLNAAPTQQNISSILEMTSGKETYYLGIKYAEMLQELKTIMKLAIEQAITIKSQQKILKLTEKIKFFQAPTQTILTNSSNKKLIVYSHPYFGRYFYHNPQLNYLLKNSLEEDKDNIIIPAFNTIIDFIKSFHHLNQ